MAGLWGNIEDDEPVGLLGGLQRGIGNPMTLAGLGLLTGGGWDAARQGMAMGSGFEQMRQSEARKRQFESLLGQINAPQDILRIAQMQGPEGGADTLAKYLDPAREADLAYKKAMTAKAQREAQFGGERPSNVREWEYFNTLTPEQKQQYLTMKRAEKYLDLGDRFAQPNPAVPGEMVREVPKNLEGAKFQETLGKERAEVAVTLPAVEAATQRALDTVEAIRNHPGKKWGVGVTGVLPGIPGTEQRGFVTLVDQAKGQAFLEAFNSLRGGGQITEAEGRKATEALARLDRAQTPQDFDAALKDYEDVIRNGLAAVRQKAGAPGASAPPASGAPRVRTYNPQTGKLE